MKISQFSVNRPITTLVTIVSVIVLGVLALQRLPLLFLPDISWPSLYIWVPYQSSSPQEVENLITIPMEDIMGTVSHLKGLRSTSSSNGASIRLEFDQSTDMEMAAVEVRDRLDRVRKDLPSDVERIYIRRWQTTDMPIFLFSVSWAGDQSKFYDLVTNVIQRKIQRIDGVANVDVRGMEEKKILVELDQDLLRAHGVDVYRLVSSLRANNLNLSAGYVMSGGKKFTIRAIGEFRDVSEIAQIPIRGTHIKLKDVASVRYDFPEKKRFQRLNRLDAITFVVYKASTANIVEVSKKVRKVLNEIKSQPGMEKLSLRVYRDQSQEILNSLNNLKWAGLIGGCLAVLILFVFLRKVRSTLIIAMAIPVSVTFTLFFMYVLRLKPFESSITLNIISMMGMVYAIGMLVDPAIVVLENIFRHKQEEGMAAREAAIAGCREVGTAVIAATLTTVIVFVPLLLMPEQRMAKFMYDFGIVICTVLISSLIVALTFVPLMASRIFVGEERQKAKSIVRMTNLYTRVVSWTLRHRLITMAIALATFTASWILYKHIDREFMPPAPSRRVDITVEMPSNYSTVEMKELFDKVEGDFLAQKDKLEIETISSNFGRGRNERGTRGSITIFLKEAGEGRRSTMELTNKIKAMLPEIAGVRFKIGRMRHMGGGEMGVSVELKGKNAEVLALLADEVKNRFQGISGVKDIDTSLETGEQEIRVNVDRLKANKYGLSSERIARTVFSALSSRATSTFKTADREIDINVQLREQDRMSLEQLQNLALENERAEMIPLSTFADFEFRKGPSSIQREERHPIVSVFANTDRIGMLGVSREIAERMKDLKLPPGYSWQMGRQYRMWRESEKGSLFAIVLAAIFVYLVMASLFESFAHPFTIIFSIPFAFIGIALAFWLAKQNLSSVAYLGVMIVCGLVVNNGIILIDHINHLRTQGMSRMAATIRGGRNRLRPILMTTATTILGLTPMVVPLFFPSVFGPSEGRAAMWAPIGLAIFGGLTTSTFLTLIILPTVYSFVDDLGHWMKKVAKAI